MLTDALWGFISPPKFKIFPFKIIKTRMNKYKLKQNKWQEFLFSIDESWLIISVSHKSDSQDGLKSHNPLIYSKRADIIHLAATTEKK